MQIWRKETTSFKEFFFIIKMFTHDCSLNGILHQQWYLSKLGNINISESEMMSDLDREFYYAMLLKDRKDEI